MEKERRPRGRPKGDRPPRKQFGLKLPPDLLERLHNAAYWTRTTVAAIIEAGALAELKKLERSLNEGKPFPPAEDRS